MERQLIKVAKELNVGMGTVVEFLAQKGFDIENRPISKVTDQMYDALSKKFSARKPIKLKLTKLPSAFAQCNPRLSRVLLPPQ